MRAFHVLTITLAIASATVPVARAHSFQEFEKELSAREKYFQPMDQPAPGFELLDAGGRAISLADFRGKVVVLHFIYTKCQDVCPLHADRIAQIQSMVNQTPMKSAVEFITITTDPRNDTPQVLHDFGAAHGLNPTNWVFLTSGPDRPDDTTRQLALAYGLKFTLSEDGSQMHGVVTHVIDQEGRLRARFHGLKFEPTNMVLYINALVNKMQEPHNHNEQSLWEQLKALF